MKEGKYTGKIKKLMKPGDENETKMCWNTNSSNTSNTWDLLWTPSAH